jgi:hypothetical protein
MALRVISNYLHPTKKVYRIIDRLAYHSKSMYNVGVYNARQYYTTYLENLRMMQTLRPDLTAKVEILVRSYLPFTRKKTFPHKDLCNYAKSKPNENFSLLHNDVAQQTLRSVEEAYRGYFGSHPKSFQRLTIPIVQSVLSPPREKLSDFWRQTSDTAPLWVSPRGGGSGRCTRRNGGCMRRTKFFERHPPPG